MDEPSYEQLQRRFLLEQATATAMEQVRKRDRERPAERRAEEVKQRRKERDRKQRSEVHAVRSCCSAPCCARGSGRVACWRVGKRKERSVVGCLGKRKKRFYLPWLGWRHVPCAMWRRRPQVRGAWRGAWCLWCSFLFANGGRDLPHSTQRERLRSGMCAHVREMSPVP